MSSMPRLRMTGRNDGRYRLKGSENTTYISFTEHLRMNSEVQQSDVLLQFAIIYRMSAVSSFALLCIQFI